MFELVLIVLQVALFLGTFTVYLLARRTASTNAAMQKNLDELLQELQATSELVVNDLNERAKALRSLLDQADTRRQQLDSAADRATARAIRDLPPARPRILAEPAGGQAAPSLASRRGKQTAPAREPEGSATELPSVRSLADEGVSRLEIARRLGITREEIDMVLSSNGTHRSSPR